MAERILVAYAGPSEEFWRGFYVVIFVVGLLIELFKDPDDHL
jgi:hypothetical protein